MGVSGILLVGCLGLFTDSMEDDCLVLDVTKDKSLAGMLEYYNCSIFKSTILLLT